MIDVGDIKGFEIFTGLDNKELKQVAKIGSIESAEAGSEIFGDNEVASTLYLLSDGRASVKMRSRAGQEVVIDELAPGDVFGWSSVLDDQTFTAAVSALEDSTLVAFDGVALRGLLKENPRIASSVYGYIAGVISGRLASLRSRLVDEPFATEWLSTPVQAGPVGPPTSGVTSEMRNMACPDCSTVNRPFGVVNDTEQYRCRNCGMVYYSPAGCETS